MLYTPRVETRLKTGRRNKVAVGALFSRLGEEYSHPFNVRDGAAWYGVVSAGVRLRCALRCRQRCCRCCALGCSLQAGAALHSTVPAGLH